MKNLPYNRNKYIDDYIEGVRSGKIIAGKRLKLALDLVERKVYTKEVYIDHDKIEVAIDIIEKYFGIKLIPWQKFILAVIHAYYVETDMVVFSDILILMGRGNGKNGFISPLTWYLTTHEHGIKGYNVDIVANNEEQAKTSFNDVYEMLDNHWPQMKKGFNKTKVEITSKLTNSYIKYNTSNARTKDGKRSACIIFDEIHEYETYDSISVFKSGFGKRKHSRAFYITTNGYVREGVLDKELEKADDVLAGKIDDLGYLPLIYELDEEEEVHDEDMWEKANPSIHYFPILKQEIKKNYIESKYDNTQYIELMTKRMNLPKEDSSTAVAEWDLIKETNQPIPYDEIKGAECIGAIDYAQVHDFVSVGLLFKLGEKRVFLEHTFVCHKSLKMESRQIRFPVREKAEEGLITIINENSIKPKHVADWFIEKASEYNIKTIVADDYRAQYLRKEFEERGLPLETVRSGPITHTKVAPLISSLFADKNLILGDNATMRWYINNTYVVLDGKGNTTYHKIEPMLRKTDGFFALVHALSLDNELKDESVYIPRLRVRTY